MNTHRDADRLRQIARERYGWDRLRPGQLEAMQALLADEDVLVVLPSGFGKSAVYQVAALALDGPTVVVSPRIALHRDQLAGLDAPEAVAVNSAQSKRRDRPRPGSRWRTAREVRPAGTGAAGQT
ncbi:MAG TPA: DEAD/DEAH box helicase [Nocardioidaceae bacterium]|nr:DEAD/DEAH box helicase [Nocardioidaceae bacterium]